MIPKNTVFYKAKLPDLLEYFKDSILLDLNCFAVGTIQTFNGSKQTATASLVYQKVVYQDTGGGIWGPVLFPYPVLVDCPVRYDFGNVGGVTVPYSQGDEVFIGFNDRDFDTWFTGTLNQGPNTSRLHGFSDAVILGGVKSLPNSIVSFDSTRPALRNKAGDSFVAVGVQKIDIHANGTTLGAVLQNLLSVLESLTVNVSTGIPNPPYVTNLASIATQLSGILE